MIIEFFGLSRTGKTTHKEKLKKLGHKTQDSSTRFQKFLYFLKHISKNTTNTLFLYKILNSNYLKLKSPSIKKYVKTIIMRNSYLFSVLAKYEQAKESKNTILVDEFTTQALFIILQKKSSEKEISFLLKKLPRPNYIFIFELPKKERELRHAKTRYPAQWIDHDYSIQWLKNSEYNYEIIKKILFKNNAILIKPINQKSQIQAHLKKLSN
jgi:hypothetical protein